MENKILLVLYPYKFTEFTYYRFELAHLASKKNIKVVAHDLSSVVSNKKYNKVWKAIREKKTIKITSLFSWISEFNKIKKTKKILIYDLLDYGNLNLQVFIIKLFLKFSKHPVLKHGIEEVTTWKAKKNLKHFFDKIFEHKFNFTIYFNKIRENIFLSLIKFIKFNKICLLVNNNVNKFKNKKNIHLVKCHSLDYSNYLLEKNRYLIKTNKKKYIIYIDNSVPYFAGDYPAEGRKLPKIDPDKWYKELNLFFDKLEIFFKAKVLIIPHSKYKIPTLKNKNINPYFCNRTTDNSYNAVAKLTPKSLFVISQGSTALSHAIVSYKPILFIYSSKSPKEWNQRREMKDLFAQAKSIGVKPIDMAFVAKRKIIKSLTVKREKYNLYKFKHLTYKSKKPPKPINKIIEDLMNQLFEKNQFKLKNKTSFSKGLDKTINYYKKSFNKERAF